MILKEIVSSKKMALRGWSCTTPAKVVNLPIVPQTDICDCHSLAFENCKYEELAFADTQDKDNEFKNDYKNILIQLLDASSTHEFFLVDSNDIEYALDDDTYGEVFASGLRVGYKLSWCKVLEELGGGAYKIRIKQTDFGNTISIDSHKFKLMKYSELAAQDTVKIETVKRGESIKGFDYTNLDWQNMIRLVAHFGNEKHNSEIERIKDSNYVDYDIQTSIEYTYTLDTHLLPSFIADTILNSDVLTDNIFITNYDAYAYRDYVRLPVVFNGDMDSSEDFVKNNKKRFSIEFKDNSQNVNRNFTI